MKKLKLNVETLRVQSFDASPDAQALVAPPTRPGLCDPLTLQPCTG